MITQPRVKLAAYNTEINQLTETGVDNEDTPVFLCSHFNEFQIFQPGFDVHVLPSKNLFSYIALHKLDRIHHPTIVWGSINSMELAFKLGVSDYIVGAAVVFKELRARALNLYTRFQQPMSVLGFCVLANGLSYKGKLLAISLEDLEVMKKLLQGIVVPRAVLADGFECNNSRALDMRISRLRKVLSHTNVTIVSHRKRGYMLIEK